MEDKQFSNTVILNIGISEMYHEDCFSMLNPWGFTSYKSGVGEWEGGIEDVMIVRGSLNCSLEVFRQLLGHICDLYEQEAISFKIEIKDLVWGMGVGPKYEFSDDLFQE